ncbi:PAS domain-containing protein, partial [Citrobacter youngae]|uniref:PAS domain-containing protein n=1 Tax=Citrobacter youngae TaxID=133448 RepID=UPI001954465D
LHLRSIALAMGSVEYRILRGDGATVWVQARGTAVDHDDAGRPARMVGTIFDITARKRNELE